MEQESKDYNVIYTSNMIGESNYIVASNLTREEAKEFARNCRKSMNNTREDRAMTKYYNRKYLSVRNDRLKRFIK